MSMLLHNMSAAPRTEACERRSDGIADRIVVFSLIYALIVRGFLEARAAGKTAEREGASGYSAGLPLRPARHDPGALAIA